MFKKTTYIPIFILAFTVVLNSCDGRYRKYKTNQQVLQEAHLLETFKNKINYIPKLAVKIEKDTILSTGFRIKINYHSIDNDTVIIANKTVKDLNINNHYKNFEAQLLVYKNDILITNSVINKKLFAQSKFGTPDFWQDAIMQFVWIDHWTSTEHNLHLNTSFHIPETNTFKDFILIINKQGDIFIEESKLLKKFI